MELVVALETKMGRKYKYDLDDLLPDDMEERFFRCIRIIRWKHKKEKQKSTLKILQKGIENPW